MSGPGAAPARLAGAADLAGAGGVVDVHCHVPDAAFVPQPFRDATVAAIAGTLQARGVRPAPGQVERIVEAHLGDGSCDGLVARMDAAGLGVAVLAVPDFSYRLPGSGPAVEELLQRVAGVLRRHEPRLRALAGVDPRWGGDGLALFERAVTSMGFGGLKVYPPCGVPASDRTLYPYYEICSARGLPVMVHTGGSASCLEVEAGRPLHVDRAAMDFPGVDFVLAHGCANLLEETITLATFRPNVYVDTSAVPVAAGSAFERVVEHGIGHKLVYGSDWPVFHTQGGLAGPLERLSAAAGPLRGLPRACVPGVFGGSARRLLGLPEHRPLEHQVDTSGAR